MKKVITTRLIVSVALIGSIAFGANKQKRRNPKANPQSTRRVEQTKPVEPEGEYNIFGIKAPKSEDIPIFTTKNDNNIFPSPFGPDQTEEQSREDFWKLFGMGAGDNGSAPTKKIPHQDAVAIIDAMNKVSDVFNKDYSFTRLDRAQFMVSLAMFLENSKSQPVLQDFLQVLKDKAVDMPWLSTCAEHIEQAINNKNAAQFWVVYSDLEGYFREQPIETRSLIRITTGWRATLRNFKDAVTTRARSAYNYIFSRKSVEQGPHMVMKSVISYKDPVTGKRVTKHITEIHDAAGKISTQEQVVKK